MSRKLFGTDGIRGKANVYPMTGEVAMSLGRAVTHYFQSIDEKTPTVVIGKDTRLSCYTIEQAFASGVCSQGGKAVLTGPLPTPGVAFVTRSMRANAGVMISASHNSFADNGIKIFDHSGHKLADEVELRLEELILDPQKIPIKTNAQLGRAKRLDEVIGRYIVYVKSAFNNRYSLEGLKIVVDCANGASYKIAPMIFDELGAKVISVGVNPNGMNINDLCGSTHPGYCALKVREHNADIGICFDGDADRVILIDNEGQIIDGDQIIGLCAKFLAEKNTPLPNNEIVGTLMTNMGLENYLKDMGLNLMRTKVGDRYIVEQMQKSGAVLGGEPSGHLIFKQFSTTGDGILAALKVLEAMIHYNKPLKELAGQVSLFPQILLNVKVKEKKDYQSNKNIVETLKFVEQKLNSKGRYLLRYSGTEPVMRIMVEAANDIVARECSQKLSDIVTQELC